MLTYDKTKPLISLHIPKCGGTSFRKVLRSWFTLGYHKHYFDHKHQNMPKHAGVKLSLQKLFPVCIHGHFNQRKGFGVRDYYPDASQFIMIMRDPLEMRLSLYFFLKSSAKRGYHWNGKWVTEPPFKSLEEFFENDPTNIFEFIPFDLTLQNYEQVIQDNFVHIGIMEQLPESVNSLAEKLGKPKRKIEHLNVSEWDEKIPDSTVKAFEEQNRLEYAMYNFARQEQE